MIIIMVCFFGEAHFLVIEWLHKQLNEDALSRPLGHHIAPTIDFSKYANTNVSPSDLKVPLFQLTRLATKSNKI